MGQKGTAATEVGSKGQIGVDGFKRKGKEERRRRSLMLYVHSNSPQNTLNYMLWSQTQ